MNMIVGSTERPEVDNRHAAFILGQWGVSYDTTRPATEQLKPAAILKSVPRGRWNWEKFEGSAEGLKWNKKTLGNLAVALALTPGRGVAVQAGGNLGIYPKRLAEDFQSVISFEPDPSHFRTMLRNAPEPNIIAMQLALGFDREGVRMQHGNETRRHEGVTHVAGPGPIPCVRLDDLSLDPVDLLVLDLEGYDFAGVRGALGTLERCRPTLMVEINRNAHRVGWTRAEMSAVLASIRYAHALRYGADTIYLPEERLK